MQAKHLCVAAFRLGRSSSTSIGAARLSSDEMLQHSHDSDRCNQREGIEIRTLSSMVSMEYVSFLPDY